MLSVRALLVRRVESTRGMRIEVERKRSDPRRSGLPGALAYGKTEVARKATAVGSGLGDTQNTKRRAEARRQAVTRNT